MINNIRIFISSPFDDMQLERDIIVKKVFPRLRLLAEQRGVSFSYVDLRWGITPGTDTYTIISTCLTEIENCSPFFIGLLGCDYGTWIPQVPNEEAKLLGERFDCVDTYLIKQLGLTEIEIRYNLLFSKNTNNNLFCLRKGDELLSSENDNRQVLLKNLKEYIIDNYSSIVRYYDKIKSFQNSNSFESIIYDYFKKIIDENFPIIENVDSRFVRLNQSSYLQTINTFLEDSSSYEELERWYSQKDSPSIYLLYGPLGLGKTHVLAGFIKNHKTICCYHFIGRSQKIETPSVIIDDIIDQLSEKLSVNRRTTINESIDEKIKDLTIIYNKIDEGPIIIVIDDIDKMVCPVHERVSFIYSLPIHENIKYIISSEDSDAPTLYSSMLSVCSNKIQPLAKDEIIQFADKYLFALYKKKLEVGFLEVLKNNQIFSRPYCLLLFLDEIATLGGYSFLRQESLLQIDSIDSIINYRIKRIESIISPDKVKRVLMLLSVFDNTGIHEDDFYSICNYNDSITREEWSIIYCNIYHLLDSWRYLIINDHFQGAIVKYYGIDLKGQRNIVASSLRQLPNNKDYVEEILYQLYFSDNINDLCEVISSPNSFLLLYSTNRDVLIKYLITIKEHGLISDFYKKISTQIKDNRGVVNSSIAFEIIAQFFSNELPFYPISLDAINNAIQEYEYNKASSLEKLQLEKMTILIGDYKLNEATEVWGILERTDLNTTLKIEFLKAKAKLLYSHPDLSIKSLSAPIIFELIIKYSNSVSISYYFELINNFLQLYNCDRADKKLSLMSICVLSEIKKITGADPYKSYKIYSHDFFVFSINQIKYSYYYYHSSDKTDPLNINALEDNINKYVDVANLINSVYGQYSKDYLECIKEIAYMYDRKCDALYSNNKYVQYCKNTELSLEYYRKIADVTKIIYQKDSYEYASSLFGIAWRMQSLFETRPLHWIETIKECITLYGQVETILNSIYSNGCELLARAWHNTADILCFIGEYDHAIACVSKAIILKKTLLGEKTDSYFNSISRLHNIFLEDLCNRNTSDSDRISMCEKSINGHISFYSTNDVNNREEKIKYLSVQLDRLNGIKKGSKDVYIKEVKDKLEIIKKSIAQIVKESDITKEQPFLFYKYGILLINEWRKIEAYVEQKNIRNEVLEIEEYVYLSNEINSIYYQLNQRLAIKDPNWDTRINDLLKGNLFKG